jgi:hypothetical protein
MTDPVTLAAALAIAKLACGKFFEASVGKLGEKFTETGLKKIDELYQKIRTKLGNNPRAVNALKAVENGKEEELQALATYLRDMMNNDQNFAADVQKIADEIEIHKVEDNSQMIQINRDSSTGYQTKTAPDNTNFFGGTHYHGKS